MPTVAAAPMDSKILKYLYVQIQQDLGKKLKSEYHTAWECYQTLLLKSSHMIIC